MHSFNKCLSAYCEPGTAQVPEMSSEQSKITMIKKFHLFTSREPTLNYALFTHLKIKIECNAKDTPRVVKQDILNFGVLN